MSLKINVHLKSFNGKKKNKKNKTFLFIEYYCRKTDLSTAFAKYIKYRINIVNEWNNIKKINNVEYMFKQRNIYDIQGYAQVMKSSYFIVLDAAHNY